MNQIELKFQKHLDQLREMAKKEGIRFVDVLLLVSKVPEIPTLARVIGESAGEKQVRAAETMIIEEYRLEYYEKIANSGLSVTEKMINALNNTKHAVKTTERQEQNLKLGRKQGATKNKLRAAAVRSLALQINDDLLKHADCARWNLHRRADYVAEKLSSATVEIEGISCPATMVNGNLYSSSTVKKWLIGT